ncbi:MAG: twin transmembrane helix small protein [Kiloniellales bacterium]|nr:twin transmembrane helix small protein [Kiloniellales bacterium]MDJ0983870.1 twin transmembrane helix small protein [Kiloniellales bacterium]
MKVMFFTLVIVAAMITLAVLVTGIFAMARGGEFNRKHSNRLMRLRVVAQGIALVLFAIAMMIKPLP